MSDNAKVTPMTVEQRFAEWLKLPGAFVTADERAFVEDMRRSSARGVGYGWMQQVIEWEWQSKGSGAWGPESHERELTAAREDAERWRHVREEWSNRKWRHVPIGNNTEFDGDDVTSEESIDAAIDAARKAT